MSSAVDERQDRPEDHDPLCPRADIEQAWNGADCACSVIHVLRGIDDVDLVTPGDYILERVTREIAGDKITQGHDPLCPPGLKAAPPDRCTWCVTIWQARQEGPIT